MSFEKKVPEWPNAGTEPSASLKASGFVGGYKPPASVFNWFWHNVVECLKELQNTSFQRAGVYTGDMNELVLPGQYRVQSTNANLPEGAYYGQVFVGRGVVNGGNNDTVSQLVIGYNTGKMFYRGALLRDGVWGWEEWSVVFSTNNKPKFNTVAWLGMNPVTTADADTVIKWASLGSGFAQYNGLGQLNDQPSRYGFLINYTYGSDVFQLWHILPSGAMYSRSGNSTGWAQSWTKIFDSLNLPSATQVGSVSLSGGEDITEGKDLNKYKTPGNFHCTGDATAATLSNCPVTNAFRMNVGYPTGGSSYIYQEIIRWNDGARFYRRCLSSTDSWSEWTQNYLSLSGGAMTGTLTTKGIKLTSGTDYGTTLPAAGTAGRLFFKVVE